jgi:histidinol-phosphatase (PHP family)
MSVQLIANYHTHTYRCGHASGTEREYIENAIRAGIKILGFSDHTPYPGAGEPPKPIPVRMDISELDGYCETVLALRDEYRDDIEIHLGLEVEYYPALFLPLMEELRARPIEYLLLAQHFTRNQHDGFHCGMPGAEVFSDYIEQLITGIETGRFTYIAHPDIVNHQGDPEVYDREMRRLCRKANEFGLPLEINLLGLGEGRSYPYPPFWKIAAEEGCRAIIGCDAHRPENVFRPEVIEAGRALAASRGIELVETLSLRDPFAQDTV